MINPDKIASGGGFKHFFKTPSQDAYVSNEGFFVGTPEPWWSWFPHPGRGNFHPRQLSNGRGKC